MSFERSYGLRWYLLVGALAFAASARSLWNGFVQDDLPIIVTNVGAHSLHGLGAALTEPYWPPPWYPALYRPLASVGYLLQWSVGGGSVVVFRAISVAAYVASCLMVLYLARRCLSTRSAGVAAALFAIHPVHTEAVGITVNQAEVLAATAVSLAVGLYVSWRRAPLSALRLCALVTLYAIAISFKESAAILPALLLAAEILIVRRRPHATERLALAKLAVGLVIVLALFAAARMHVLRGNVTGTFTAEALVQSDLAGRALTMLGVVPEWARLLYWPARLQADYSPSVISAATAWTARQFLGLAVLLAAVALAGVGWIRGETTVTFAIAWLVIALAPVSNVLVPTGIVLAERTLYLASVGAVLLIGGGLSAWETRRLGHPASNRVWGFWYALIALVLVTGIVRSHLRYEGFRNHREFWLMTLEDAPMSYRANLAIAEMIYLRSNPEPSRRYYRTAIELFPQGSGAYYKLANRYRMEGDCKSAIPLYRSALENEPRIPAARAAAIACLLYEGAYMEAGTLAKNGQRYSPDSRLFVVLEATADSARSAQAPSRTVRVHLDPKDLELDRFGVANPVGSDLDGSEVGE